MSVTSRILAPVWHIERNRVRRCILPLAVIAVVALRLIGWLLVPLLVIIWCIAGIAAGLWRAATETVEASIGTWRSEGEQWRTLARVVPKVWATSFDRRPVPTLIARKPKAPPRPPATDNPLDR